MITKDFSDSLKYGNRLIILFVSLLFSFALISIGITTNQKVVVENGCRMPVFSYYSVTDSTTHFSYIDPKTIKSPELSDKFVLDTKTHWYRFSIGDILMWTGGLFMFVVLFLFITYTFELNKIHKRLTNANVY